jgi:hypothetical protein
MLLVHLEIVKFGEFGVYFGEFLPQQTERTMETMAPLFARVCLFGLLFFFVSFPARTARTLNGQGSEIELFPEFQSAFSHATSSNQPWVSWEGHVTNKVETPSHDNDLILTPIISPRSG